MSYSFVCFNVFKPNLSQKRWGFDVIGEGQSKGGLWRATSCAQHAVKWKRNKLEEIMMQLKESKGIFLFTLDHGCITSRIFRIILCFIGFTTCTIFFINFSNIFYFLCLCHVTLTKGAACALSLQSFHHWQKNDVSILLSRSHTYKGFDASIKPVFC